MAASSEWYFIIAIFSALGLCTALACCCAFREWSRGRRPRQEGPEGGGFGAV
jgi:hypothetical protein